MTTNEKFADLIRQSLQLNLGVKIEIPGPFGNGLYIRQMTEGWFVVGWNRNETTVENSINGMEAAITSFLFHREEFKMGLDYMGDLEGA